MKYSLLLLLSFVLFAATAQIRKNSFYKPSPKRYTPVNDFASLLTKEENNLLSKKISCYKDSTGNTIVIIIQNNLTDTAAWETYPVEEVALHYFNKWGIGKKGKNDGLLIFVAKEDRKVRITTGKGIDSLLTANDCQAIIDNNIVPNFKIQQYYKGLDAAVDGVIQILSPSETAAQFTPPTQSVASGYNYAANEEVQGSGMFGLGAILGVLALIATILIRFIWRLDGQLYSGTEPFINDHRRSWFGSGYQNYNDNSVNNSFGSDGFSSSSSGDSQSSSDSSSSSFDGGSSSGGGASGSW